MRFGTNYCKSSKTFRSFIIFAWIKRAAASSIPCVGDAYADAERTPCAAVVALLLDFAKYEGAGNDFILLDSREVPFPSGSKLIAKLCDRHFGIGADGLMLLGKSEQTVCDCSMRYYNADGSAGEMCGNGGRCFALFARHLGLGTPDRVTFEAPDGVHRADLLHVRGDEAVVELGIIRVHGIRQGDGWWFLNTGVPHYVEFVTGLDGVDVTRRGRAIRHDSRFREGTNVDFVQIAGAGHIRVRTYERGVEAETLACGTGATAAALVTHHAMQHECTRFTVDMPGGRLGVAFVPSPDGSYDHIRLSGGARRVFRGTIDCHML